MYEVWMLCEVDGQRWRQAMCRCDWDWQAKDTAEALTPAYPSGAISWGLAANRPNDLPWLNAR